MTRIIPLKRHTEGTSFDDTPVRSESDTKSSYEAQVIIFPGVRYERWDDAQSSDATCSSDASAHDDVRDWLEI